MKKLINDVRAAIKQCELCKGKGLIPYYTQACEITNRRGKYVALADCTTFKCCDRCHGSGSR